MNYTRGFSLFNKFLFPIPSIYTTSSNRIRAFSSGFTLKSLSSGRFQQWGCTTQLSPPVSISSGILSSARFCSSASHLSTPSETTQIPLSWSEFNLIREPQSQLQQVTAIKLDEKLEKSLEINDPKVIFDSVWRELEKKVGRENLHFPREIILLMGAPGSGKSYNAPYIRRARDISAPELIMSSVLNSPEAQDIKKNGRTCPR